jgi:hypothetical protein
MDSKEMEQRVAESDELKQELIALRVRLRAEHLAVADLTAKYDALCCSAVDGDEAVVQEAAALHARAEMSRPRIRNIEALIGQKEAAKAKLDQVIWTEMEKQRQEDERAAKYERWQGLFVECGTAREQMESLTKQLTAAQDVVDEQAGVIQRRRDDLSAILEAKPTPSNYPTQAELAKWDARHKAAEAAVTKAFAEMKRRTDHRGSIAAQQLQARIRFEQLVSQERMARLPGFELATAS